MDEVPRVSQDSPPEPATQRLVGADAIKLHLTLLVGLALCAFAFWFELGRALRGNSLSWAYVFEWPMLGAFGVYMWWKLLHGATTGVRRKRAAKPAIAPEYSGMLAAWQEYQRDLNASHDPPTSDDDAVPDSSR